MTPEKLVHNFNRCMDWEERYLYLIELGEKLPIYPSDKQTTQYLVHGCQSKVWLYMDNNDVTGLIKFHACSDAAIVQGLLALLSVAYHACRPDEVLTFDIESWFDALELKNHLTPSRAQGLDAIVNRIRQQAIDLVN